MNEPNRRVLVTGANRGLGLEFVRQLLARGDTVVATYRQSEGGLSALAGQFPGRLHRLVLDVAQSASFPGFQRQVAERVEALDWLINNAGLLPSGERFGDLRAVDLTAAFVTNAVAPLLLTQALVPLLALGRKPCVLNISSVLGSIARTEAFRTPSYAISKAALNMAAVLMGRELAGQGIRVVNLHPGWVRTRLGGEQAPLTPEQAVNDMLATLVKIPADAQGLFLDRLGEPLPW